MQVLKRKGLVFNLLVLVYMLPLSTFANDGSKPPDTINSFGIASKVLPHMFDYMHFKIIGACVWWHCNSPFDCGINVTPELDEYLPDLIVSSYTGHGNNPYWEASQLDKVAYSSGNTLFHTIAHLKSGVDIKADLANGNTTGLSSTDHYDSVRTKSVDVIGSPMILFHIPFMVLKADTQAFNPYYQSDMDTLGRLGLAELIRPETLLPTNYIGDGFLNHWGYEFPRDMTVNVYNDYKASVIAAQRAADIVTNRNALHSVQSTSNSCGDNCVVANVIEEQKDKNEIWQEVYPHDKHIHPGDSDLATTNSLGNDDANAGNNNYVFVVWRHYRGCIQSEGHLIMQSVSVGEPQKR